MTTTSWSGEGVISDEATGAMVCDSVTRLSKAAGRVVVTGSHGGRYPASLVAACGALGAIFNDASGGLEGAGTAGLQLLESVGIPAAAVTSLSARIGDGRSTLADGVIGHVNGPARDLGCRVGDPALAAVARLQTVVGTATEQRNAPEYGEARHLIADGPHTVWALDSVSLVLPEDRNAILVTGSHGALLGGRPESALKRDAFAAIYNDAGGGPGERGRTRLPVLDARGIAAATVHAETARIGDGRSTYDTGVVSNINGTCKARGGTLNMTCRELVAALASAEPPR